MWVCDEREKMGRNRVGIMGVAGERRGGVHLGGNLKRFKNLKIKNMEGPNETLKTNARTAFEVCSGQGHHEGGIKQEGALWFLYGEIVSALESENVSKARAAVNAFTTLLNAKLENGERGSFMLFCAIRVTEASGAGGYNNDYPSKLEDIDMRPMWEAIDRVNPAEWSNYNETPDHGNCIQMIERATGRA